MNAQKNLQNNVIFVLVLILAILFLSPIFIVLMNSFKGRFYISDTPFALPNAQTFGGLEN
jgi:raffinose/stachyose/melibiose transport system permease protein